MSELRWILIGLGVAFITGLYVWGRKPFGEIRFPGRQQRIEPEVETEPPPTPAPKPRLQRSQPERVVTLRVVRHQHDEMSAVDAVLALKRVGLVHGQYGIFHRLPDGGSGEPLFSVASLTEPGSFDLENLDQKKIAGLSVFLVLPGSADPVARFDSMLELARGLADDLEGILLDERGSSWSIQRERYLREEIIQYRHQRGYD